MINFFSLFCIAYFFFHVKSAYPCNIWLSHKFHYCKRNITSHTEAGKKVFCSNSFYLFSIRKKKNLNIKFQKSSLPYKGKILQLNLFYNYFKTRFVYLYNSFIKTTPHPQWSYVNNNHHLNYHNVYSEL